MQKGWIVTLQYVEETATGEPRTIEKGEAVPMKVVRYGSISEKNLLAEVLRDLHTKIRYQLRKEKEDVQKNNAHQKPLPSQG